MRLDGDRLLDHVARATVRVLLCAPFIKVRVLENLLRVVRPNVEVRVVTRWLPVEVAVGVSDLEVFDVVRTRPGTTLELLDNVHAKIYLADERALVGSANLTGPALGWSAKPNVELLVELDGGEASVSACLRQLADARPATVEERDRVRQLALALPAPPLDLVLDAAADVAPALWLPKLAAPARLYQAYVERTRDRLAASVLEAALEDLSALAIPANLPEPAFKAAVAAALRTMPATLRILRAAADDIQDAKGAELIRGMAVDGAMDADQRWLVVREWLTYFLGETYEIAPQNFVLRLRAGAKRP